MKEKNIKQLFSNSGYYMTQFSKNYNELIAHGFLTKKEINNPFFKLKYLNLHEQTTLFICSSKNQ